MATKKLKKPKVNAPKPAKPNKLYFYEQVSKSDGKTRYGWRLKSMNGKVIGASSELYSKKIYAIRNVATLFGLELLEGTHPLHVIPDEARSPQVVAEAVRQRNG